MRIHEIIIDNFKAIGHLELRELPDTGVIVIAGDNEQGKSTIMEAIDTVLNIKHRSSAQVVKAIQPVGRDVPSTVSLKLTVGEVSLRITKQYNRKKSATLDILAPRTENLTGDQAEDRLAEILAQHTDEQLLATLFMRQGTVDAAIEAVGIPTLAQALDGQRENSGAEDTALNSAVEREYLRYHTPKGKESGELSKARAEAEAADTELEGARLEVEALSGHVDAVARLTAESERAEAARPGAREDLAAKEAAKLEAEDAQDQVAALTEDLARATAEVARAQAEQQRREVLRREVAELRADVQAKEQGREDASGKANQEAETLETLNADLTVAREAEAAAAAELKAAKLDLQLLTQEQRRDALSELLASIDEIDDQLAEVGDSTPITAAQVAAVEEASTDLAVQQKVRDSLAAKLTLRATTPTEVEIDGAAVPVATTAQIIELSTTTTLKIGELIAEFTPGESTGTDTVAEATHRLDALLQELDCPDVAEVRRRSEQSRRVAETTAGLERERTHLLKKQDPAQLRREVDTLNLQLAEAAIPTGELESAAAAVDAAEQALSEATESVKLLESRLEPWREKKHFHALNLLLAQLEAAELAVERKAAELESTEAEQSESELRTAVTQAEEQRQQVAARLSQAEQELALADPELATQFFEGAQAKLAGLEESLHRAGHELARLTGYIEQSTGADERLDRAESAATAAEHKLASVERRATAAAVLKEVLERHQAQARSRYAQPFAEQLTSLARTVFGPEVTFTLDEKLQVAARSIGERAVPLEALSGGAKEQLAILTRFAIARLVAEQEESVPVFVDDALGSTDPGRLDRMAALFSQAGRTSQVFVLTCVPQRYESVTGKHEYRIEDLKTQLSLVQE
ncbi:AAA family ATPase [Corynebacterium sp. A21]|uniref:AAA family ATPase n=1 Tax=Corynebacterium sp. A21 TaxID=3457318 RepID=UPI003FCF107E